MYQKVLSFTTSRCTGKLNAIQIKIMITTKGKNTSATSIGDNKHEKMIQNHCAEEKIN